jgi:hypothetical protein
VEKGEMNLVCRFLNVTSDKEKVGRYFTLFMLAALACMMTHINKNVEWEVIGCALVIFFSMYSWGERIKKKDTFLFLYRGVESSLLSLCCMLIVLGLSRMDLMHAFIALVAMLLVSIPRNIYLANQEARKMISRQEKLDDTKLVTFLSVVSSLGILIGALAMKNLSVSWKCVTAMICFGILFYRFLGSAIRSFHKESIRRRYNITIEYIELKNWLVKYDIKEMLINGYHEWRECYDIEEPEEYAEIFESKDIHQVQYEVHSVGYVIHEYIGIVRKKYIAATLRLIYDGVHFAEYVAIYEPDGEVNEDYLRMVE